MLSYGKGCLFDLLLDEHYIQPCSVTKRNAERQRTLKTLVPKESGTDHGSRVTIDRNGLFWQRAEFEVCYEKIPMLARQ